MKPHHEPQAAYSIFLDQLTSRRIFRSSHLTIPLISAVVLGLYKPQALHPGLCGHSLLASPLVISRHKTCELL